MFGKMVYKNIYLKKMDVIFVYSNIAVPKRKL